MKFWIVTVLLLFACNVVAGSTSVTSSNTSINSSTSITTNSSNNVSSSTSISTTTGTSGTSKSFCSTSDTYQQCEITCERPKVAQCVDGTADKPPRCTCRQPRKKRNRN